jgi:hypothetical protein
MAYQIGIAHEHPAALNGGAARVLLELLDHSL